MFVSKCHLSYQIRFTAYCNSDCEIIVSDKSSLHARDETTWKHIISVFMWMCVFCIYICDSYASLKTHSSQMLLLNEKKERKQILEPKCHDPNAFLTHVCASFPAQLAWKDGKHNLIFHGAKAQSMFKFNTRTCFISTFID